MFLANDLISLTSLSSNSKMTHTNSNTWISTDLAEKDRWDTVEKSLKRMRFDRSPFVPADLDGWLEHRAAYADCQAATGKRRLIQKERLFKAGSPTRRYAIRVAFGGRTFSGNRGFVLSHCSMWSPWFVASGTRPIAAWPVIEELKEEGDERHTSGFGRFLPIPRVPGNETVAWKQKAFVPASPMDCVYPVPWKHEKCSTKSPLDCPSPGLDLFRRPVAFDDHNWNYISCTESAAETAHWDTAAETTVRLLDDDASSETALNEAKVTAEAEAKLVASTPTEPKNLAERRGISLDALPLHEDKVAEYNIERDNKGSRSTGKDVKCVTIEDCASDDAEM